MAILIESSSPRKEFPLAIQSGEELIGSGVSVEESETSRTLGDLSPGAMPALKRLLRGNLLPFSDLTDLEILTRLGVLLPNGRLTAAGVQMFCSAPRTVLELAVLDVPGGDVVATSPDLTGLSLVEQLAEIEARLDVLDTTVSLQIGLRLDPVRQVPWPAVREALLNAIVHRDWLPAETIHVTWVIADASLDVVSPGGFVGGVTSDSVLSARYSRNPALADLARAMSLVERQGVGVDRMYREMVSLGHRPPTIRQEPGPQVRTHLLGGRPLPAVIASIAAVSPPGRQRDIRVALGIHLLLKSGFLAAASLAPLLQVLPHEADEAIDVLTDCTVDGEPLIRRAPSGLWLPAKGITARATAEPAALAQAQRRGLLTWFRPTSQAAENLVRAHLAAGGRISSGELADITGLTGQGALNLLTRLEGDGMVRRGPASKGRKAHFIAAD